MLQLMSLHNINLTEQRDRHDDSPLSPESRRSHARIARANSRERGAARRAQALLFHHAHADGVRMGIDMKSVDLPETHYVIATLHTLRGISTPCGVSSR